MRIAEGLGFMQLELFGLHDQQSHVIPPQPAFSGSFQLEDHDFSPAPSDSDEADAEENEEDDDDEDEDDDEEDDDDDDSGNDNTHDTGEGGQGFLHNIVVIFI